MLNKDLIGKEVVGADAWKVGTVTRVMINWGDWQVKELEVGLDQKVVQALNAQGAVSSSSAKIGVDQIQGVSDKVILKINRDDLTKLFMRSQASEAKIAETPAHQIE
jgi:sporulation protein YlmC with PRC-barrel domain